VSQTRRNNLVYMIFEIVMVGKNYFAKIVK